MKTLFAITLLLVGCGVAATEQPGAAGTTGTAGAAGASTDPCANTASTAGAAGTTSTTTTPERITGRAGGAGSATTSPGKLPKVTCDSCGPNWNEALAAAITASYSCGNDQLCYDRNQALADCIVSKMGSN